MKLLNLLDIRLDLFNLDCEIERMDQKDYLTELEMENMLELIYVRVELSQFLMNYNDNTCLVQLDSI